MRLACDIRRALLLGALVLGAPGCGGDPARQAAPDTTRDGLAAERLQGAHFSVQLGAFADSTNALRLRDSLERTGWPAYVRVVEADGRRVWRVSVPLAGSPDLARVAAFALARARGSQRGAVVVRDTGYAVRPRVTGFEYVNRGSHGMAARTRWALSPNRGAILVMEDPASVEADAFPNAFFLGHEEGMRSVRMDSVWDASPSPDWRRVAFGRAYVLRGEREDTLRTEQWDALASRLRMPVDSVRRHAFLASGMATIFGFAQPGVIELGGGEPRLFQGAGGWRVRWSVDGSRLLAGLAPQRTQDDAPATRWVAFDPATGKPLGDVAPNARSADLRWSEGPTVDISIAPDTATLRTLPATNGTVESRGGWIRVGGRIIGPGVALATTRGGRYVVALVPNVDAKEYDHQEVLAVYTLEY